MNDADHDHTEEEDPPRLSGLDLSGESRRPDWLVGPDEGAVAEASRMQNGAPAETGPRTMPGLIPLDGRARVDVANTSTPGAWWPGRTGRVEKTGGPEKATDPAPWVRGSGIDLAGQTGFDQLEMAAIVPHAEEEPSEAVNHAGHAPPRWTEVEEDPPPAATRQRPPAADVADDPAQQQTVLSRKHLLLAAAAVLVVITGFVMFHPGRDSGVPLSKIRRDPARYDGLVVSVHGRVGEVFPVGNSYAFNLHQGRDTIVVFTRTRIPVSQRDVTVMGSVSTGYLEGVPRAAIFEQAP